MMISRFHLTVFLIWIAVTAVSYFLFSYLANHPEVMLGIEKNKPGILMLSGREFVQSKNLQEALNAFSQAKDQFTELYEETGLEHHKSYMANATYSLASAYHVLGVTPEWQKAIPIFQEALDLNPDGHHGLWHLSKGMVHQQLQQYKEAIHHLDQAMDLGTGFTQRYVLYERGRSYLMTGKLEQACDDLYEFIRSLGKLDEISEEQWLEFVPLQQASNPKKHYILAAMYRFLQDVPNAVSEIQTYLQYHPNNRAALYIQSSLMDKPFVQDSGIIALDELIPSQHTVPYILTGSMLNLYMAAPGSYTLSLELSSFSDDEIDNSISENDEKEDKIDLPEFTIHCNGKEQTKFFVTTNTPSNYGVELELMEGKNIVRLHTQPSSILELLYKIKVQSIELSSN